MVFSLADVTGTIYNNTYGQLEFGGGNQTIGSIGYTFSRKSFSMTPYADGGAVVSHDKSKAGTVDIKISQTSSKYKEMVKFIKWCHANPSLAESICTVRDNIGVMQFTAYGFFPEAEPGNTVSETASDNTVTFLSSRIVTNNV